MQIGRMIFGMASAALGVIALVWGAFAFAWQAVPPEFPGYHPLAYAAGILLLASGLGVNAARTARLSGLVLAVVYSLFAVPWAIRVVRFPQLFGVWGGLAEQVSLVLAAVIILRKVEPASANGRSVEDICFKAYGVCALVFGFNHFFSLAQTAAMVPKWLPPSQMFWAVATGVFHCAAGVAILGGVRALLATRLLACMMLVFEALVWLPYLLNSPTTHMLWAGNAVDIVLAGAALVIADEMARRAGYASAMKTPSRSV
jgi:uncharacterized membrane protein YphA (DoxX/SURF4 family)